MRFCGCERSKSVWNDEILTLFLTLQCIISKRCCACSLLCCSWPSGRSGLCCLTGWQKWLLSQSGNQALTFWRISEAIILSAMRGGLWQLQCIDCHAICFYLVRSHWTPLGGCWSSLVFSSSHSHGTNSAHHTGKSSIPTEVMRNLNQRQLLCPTWRLPVSQHTQLGKIQMESISTIQWVTWSGKHSRRVENK